MQTPHPEFAPEFELIVRCAHLDPRERNGDLVRTLLDRRVDWTGVLTLAQRHGVTALLHCMLGGRLGNHVPSSVSGLLARRSVRETERNERLRAVLGRLLEALAEAGIDAIPLRSARLAICPGEFIEVDVLVRRRDAAAAWAVLTAHRFEPETRPGHPAHVLLRTQGARRFVHRNGQVVSILWDVADPALRHGPSVGPLWRRASPAKLCGSPCLALSPADQLIIACVRGTLHRWQRLIWLREVAELIAEADVAGAETLATKSGAARALALGTSLAARLIGGVATPRDAAADPVTAGLERTVLRDITSVVRPLRGPAEIARFHLGSRERVRDRVAYLLRRATWPGPDDALARVPGPLFSLGGALLAPHRAVNAVVELARRSRPYRAAQIARFVPTPPHVVDRMLALAGATADDVLLDLGCGDGAILLRAAQRVRCRGVGIDFDAGLVETARRRARKAGVGHLVEFRHGDARAMDLSPFTVVCLYLGAVGNPIIRPYLERGLRPGTRVVSFNFDMGDWWADEVEILDETPWGSNTLYLWRIA